jgi:heme a synthase
MVQSGLAGRTDVSQYRLAAHLSLACLVFAYTLWLAYGVGYIRRFPRSWNAYMAILLLVLIFAQIAMGGIMAGLDAGNASNTWPLMNGAWIPDGLWTLQPQWLNAFENALAIHFLHRALAYVILILAAWHAWKAFNLPSLVLAYVVFTQATLGILVVLMNLPVGMALAHQAVAMFVLAMAVRSVHREVSRPVPAPDQR